MTTTTTAQVATLHPRPARKPAAVQSPHKRKAKATKRHNWTNFDYFLRRGLGHARAALGLANGLHELFSIRLAEAEEDLARLDRTGGDDAGLRFAQQLKRTEDLRTWVGVLVALKERADWAESAAEQAAERVGWVVRRGGSQ